MANIGGLFSNLEGALNALDNKSGKMDKAKEVFRREIGVSKEMADKAEDLIDTFDDMDKAYEEHKDIVEDCDKEIQKLTNSISNLQGHLNNATTQQNRNRIQSEIDKKQRELLDKQSKRDVNARKRDEAETKRDNANRRFDKLFGRRIAMGDITALNNKNKAISAISSGGKFANMANGLKGLKGNPYMMIAEGLIKAVEFGIGKSTEYMKLNAENTLRELNAVAQVSLNQLKANVASWQDSLSGAYTSQDLALDSQMTLLQSQNATTLANLKMANTWTNWIPIWGEVNKYQEAALEIEQKYAETRLANAQKFIQQANEFTKLTDDYLRKQDKAIHQYQAQNGLTVQQTMVYEKRMLTQAETFAHYNKTIEDVVKLQTDFIQQSGRNVNFSNSDMEKSLAVGRLVGDDTFTQFSAQMNVFNQSVSSSADIMYDMYNYANKMGLSQQKLTKNVLSNLKLANKYDFKNGSKGFIELAKWAENVRFNLSSLGGMLEKIQSGGLEGTVETSAKLQVLGGHFAMGSDPLAMMWESLNDPDAYAKRTKGMFKGLGTYDKTTGETTFNGTDTLLIRNAASALGMSVEDAKDMIREDNKKAVIRRQVHNSNLSSEQMDAVANKAHRDAVTGKWMVNMLDNSTKDISTITSADLQNILSDNSDENMSRYAQSTLSSVEKIESATKTIAAILGADTFVNFADTAEKSVQTMLEAYTNNESEIVKAIVMNRAEALKEQKESFKSLPTIASKLEAIYEILPHEWRETADKDALERSSQEGRNQVRTRNDIENYDNDKEISSAMLMFHRAKAEKRNVAAQVRDWFRGFFMSDESAVAKARITKDKWDKRFNSDGFDTTPIYTKDGTMSANGQSMTVAASSVTPIHDGSVKLAKTDPQDSAIFAKTGGPFDTLFNGVFAKINEVSEILPKAMNYEMPTREIVNTIKQTNSTISSQNEKQSIDINIHGDLRLNTDGKSIDISKLIETDPMFIRRITDLILTQIDDNVHGGRQSKMFHTRASVNFV
ncbi:MAG: hypothetical protein K2I18_08125 [Paramuribaculum sp.]|nr:hypothetical protein [Paramuribaculum sp.]